MEDASFLPVSKVNKIFNRNSVKISHSFKQNLSQTIKGHNKKVTQMKLHRH